MHPYYFFGHYDKDHILEFIIFGDCHHSFPKNLTYDDVKNHFVSDESLSTSENKIQHLLEKLHFKIKYVSTPKLDEELFNLINQLPDVAFSQKIDEGPAMLMLCNHRNQDIYEAFSLRHSQMFPDISEYCMLHCHGDYKRLEDGRDTYRYCFDVACDNFGVEEFVTYICSCNHMSLAFTFSFKLLNAKIESNTTLILTSTCWERKSSITSKNFRMKSKLLSIHSQTKYEIKHTPNKLPVQCNAGLLSYSYVLHIFYRSIHNC